MSAIGHSRAAKDAIPEPNDNNVLTIAEVAERLRVSPRTVKRLIASGTLCAAKIGRSVRVQRTAVEALFGDIIRNKNRS
jgi:excisionase family DNA binding protein